ncbi:MAG TPA: hypothetical protein VNW29_06965 [Candidatus Sulfotelmatobacter sp.]|jgi:VCBS repeat-containing protein|nr:hypothetical protein [Candidatus Sulfotelmatobacter sp.]
MADNKRTQIIDKNPNKIPNNIVITWGNNKVSLGKFRFAKNGSFYFSTPQFDKTSMEIGSALKVKDTFQIKSKEATYQTTKGVHLSLHPPDDKHEKGILQLTGADSAKPVGKVVLDWFPVKGPFKLFHFFTLPLDLAPVVNSKAIFTTPIPEKYKDSLEIIVDILPIENGLMSVPMYDNDIWNFTGFSAFGYAVSTRLVFANQRLVPQIYYINEF